MFQAQAKSDPSDAIYPPSQPAPVLQIELIPEPDRSLDPKPPHLPERVEVCSQAPNKATEAIHVSPKLILAQRFRSDAFRARRMKPIPEPFVHVPAWQEAGFASAEEWSPGARQTPCMAKTTPYWVPIE